MYLSPKCLGRWITEAYNVDTSPMPSASVIDNLYNLFGHVITEQNWTHELCAKQTALRTVVTIAPYRLIKFMVYIEYWNIILSLLDLDANSVSSTRNKLYGEASSL